MTYSDLPTRVETPKSLFNPLRTDFVYSLRDDNNIKREYKIRSMEIDTFPAYIADILIKHLIDEVVNTRDNADREEIQKEVEV